MLPEMLQLLLAPSHDSVVTRSLLKTVADHSLWSWLGKQSGH